MLRVLCIGLDGRVADPGFDGHAVRWTREMARMVDDYVVVAEATDGHDVGPVRLADNAVAYRLAGPRALYPFRAARLAQRLHAEDPFHVVTTEDPIRAGLGGALFSQRTGVPLNVENHSLHINEPVWLTSRYYHRLFNVIAIHVARRAVTIRNYSPDQIGPLQRIGIPMDRVFVVPAPAPPVHPCPRQEAREALGIAPGESIVLAAGRLVPYKSVDTLLSAFADVRRERKARLMLAGTGPCGRAWKRQARRLGVEHDVQWLGNVPEPDMARLYAAADVFVAAAVHETGPRTVLEAYLAECPVIATPQMGVVHFNLCTHGETGLVVSPHEPARMAEALEMLLADPDWARRMAREGRARVEKLCDIRVIARQVAELLRETARRTQHATIRVAADFPE